MGASDSARGSLLDYDTATALLERVIQRIFTAGVLLHAAPGNGDAARLDQPALDQLDVALNDIRATVLTWAVGSKHHMDYQPIDELDTAIAHLGIADQILRRLTAGYSAECGRTRWTAANHADQCVHRALTVLGESSRWHTDAELAPPARVPGTRQPH